MGISIDYLDNVQNIKSLVVFENANSVTSVIDKDFDVPLTEKMIDYWEQENFVEHLHDHGLIVLATKGNSLLGFACYNNHDKHINIVKISVNKEYQNVIDKLILYIEKVALAKNQNVKVYCQRYLEAISKLKYHNLGDFWIKKIGEKNEK